MAYLDFLLLLTVSLGIRAFIAVVLLEENNHIRGKAEKWGSTTRDRRSPLRAIRWDGTLAGKVCLRYPMHDTRFGPCGRCQQGWIKCLEVHQELFDFPVSFVSQM